MKKSLLIGACLLGLSAVSAAAASTCTQARASCLARGGDAKVCETLRTDCYMTGCWADPRGKTCGLIKK